MQHIHQAQTRVAQQSAPSCWHRHQCRAPAACVHQPSPLGNSSSRDTTCSSSPHSSTSTSASASWQGQQWQLQHPRRRVQCAAIAQAPAAATTDMSKALSLSLEDIRSSLIRQEDTIIFNFIERAQFARNLAVYTSDAVPVPGYDRSGKRYSLLQYVLRETEQLHAKLRRYTSPDEHPFFPDDLPPMVLPPISYPSLLAPCAESVNINEEVMRVYLDEVLPGITPPGDDYNYGSAGVLDVLCLQALSKRIHYGKFVAEAKFRAQTEEYTALIKAQDADGIMALLTDKAVERKVVERVRLKAATFGQDITAPSNAANGNAPKVKVCPDVVAAVYEKWVMPLTKEVEVQYLLRRLDHA